MSFKRTKLLWIAGFLFLSIIPAVSGDHDDDEGGAYIIIGGGSHWDTKNYSDIVNKRNKDQNIIVNDVVSSNTRLNIQDGVLNISMTVTPTADIDEAVYAGGHKLSQFPTRDKLVELVVDTVVRKCKIDMHHFQKLQVESKYRRKIMDAISRFYTHPSLYPSAHTTTDQVSIQHQQHPFKQWADADETCTMNNRKVAQTVVDYFINFASNDTLDFDLYYLVHEKKRKRANDDKSTSKKQKKEKAPDSTKSKPEAPQQNDNQSTSAETAVKQTIRCGNLSIHITKEIGTTLPKPIQGIRQDDDCYDIFDIVFTDFNEKLKRSYGHEIGFGSKPEEKAPDGMYQ